MTCHMAAGLAVYRWIGAFEACSYHISVRGAKLPQRDDSPCQGRLAQCHGGNASYARKKVPLFFLYSVLTNNRSSKNPLVHSFLLDEINLRRHNL